MTKSTQCPRTSNNAKSNSGFTLMELLVAINVAFLLVSLSLMLFLFATKAFGSWQQRVSVRAAVNSFLQRVILDAEHSSNVAVADSTVLLTGESGSASVEYKSSKEQVWRNDVPFGAKNVAVTAEFTRSDSTRILVKAIGQVEDYRFERVAAAAIGKTAREHFLESKEMLGSAKLH